MVLLIVLFQVFQSGSSRSGRDPTPYSTFLTQVEQGQVSEVTILTSQNQGHSISGKLTDGTLFNTYAPEDPRLVEMLTAKNVKITAKADDESPNMLVSLLINWAPLLIIAGAWI